MNTTITIDCTKRGSSVTGPYGATTLWDHTNSVVPGFVSDAWVYTGTGSAVAPTCGSVSASTKAARAVTWARAQLGKAGWNGWCDKFVANAYGLAASGYSTAYAHYKNLLARGLIHGPSTGTPPAGALAFFAPAAVNGNAGHVQLSEGNGYYISSAPVVSRVTLSWPRAAYLGWAYANPEWPGR